MTDTTYKVSVIVQKKYCRTVQASTDKEAYQIASNDLDSNGTKRWIQDKLYWYEYDSCQVEDISKGV